MNKQFLTCFINKANNNLNEILSIKDFPRMDFQNYINHNTKHSSNKPSNTKKTIEQKPRVIKFVGNMEENIKELLYGINCQCGNKKEFYNILIVFAGKIQKLRTERDHYKNTFKEYLLTMNGGSSTARNHSSVKATKMADERLKAITSKLQSYPSTVLHSVGNNKQNLNHLSKVAKLFHREDFKTEYTQQNSSTLKKKKSNQNQNQEQWSNFTAVKKVQKEDVQPLKQVQSEDKKMSYFYQTNNKSLNEPNDEGSFSLNLSSFEDLENKENDTSEFMKEVSSIMSQTNLLDSDDEEQQQRLKMNSNYTSSKNSSKLSQLEEKVNKLRMLKQSTNFDEILLSLNDQDDKAPQIRDFMNIKKDMTKKKENSEETKAQRKSVKKAAKHDDKENVKVESCLKKYNISLEKLEQFIENKQCFKQLQNTQAFDINLKNFKSISSCTLKNDLSKQFQSLYRAPKPGRALEERKFHFNI